MGLLLTLVSNSPICPRRPTCPRRLYNLRKICKTPSCTRMGRTFDRKGLFIPIIFIHFNHTHNVPQNTKKCRGLNRPGFEKGTLKRMEL